MDKKQAAVMYAALSEELEELRERIQDLMQRESGLVKVIEGISELYPDLMRSELEASNTTGGTTPLARGGKPTAPRGQEAVQLILEAAAPRWLTVEEITDEMGKRGWKPTSDDPVGAVRSATVRLLRNRGVVRRKKGRSYSYRVPYESKDSEALSEAEGF